VLEGFNLKAPSGKDLRDEVDRMLAFSSLKLTLHIFLNAFLGLCDACKELGYEAFTGRKALIIRKYLLFQF